MVFRFRRKDKIIDLSAKYNKRIKNTNLKNTETNHSLQQPKQDSEEFVPLPFFDMNNETKSSDSEIGQYPKRELEKQLRDFTEKIENLSNQIYHLEQRLELVEKKLDIGKF